jgi:hypothetical protein
VNNTTITNDQFKKRLPQLKIKDTIDNIICRKNKIIKKNKIKPKVINDEAAFFQPSNSTIQQT